MKKYAIILTAALFVCAFSGCDEEAPSPTSRSKNRTTTRRPEGDDPDTYTVAYRLDKVLLCAPENPNGTDIYGKLDYFPSLRMTLKRVAARKPPSRSTTATSLSYRSPKRCPKAHPVCAGTATSSPTCCGSKVADTIIATFEQGRLSTQFQLGQQNLLTYQIQIQETL